MLHHPNIKVSLGTPVNVRTPDLPQNRANPVIVLAGDHWELVVIINYRHTSMSS